jgi:DNA-binding MarR family transcriptional regulator
VVVDVEVMSAIVTAVTITRNTVSEFAITAGGRGYRDGMSLDSRLAEDVGSCPLAAAAGSDEERAIIDLSARFAHAFLRHLDGSTKGGFSYPRLRVLEYLHCKGPTTMRPLAEGLGLSARNMTAVADSLEADGFLRRVAHPTDRRATILELTDDGVVAAEAALAPRFAEISALFEPLSDTQRRRFVATLSTLVDRMEQGCPESGCAGSD